jgi:hypothetical protein
MIPRTPLSGEDEAKRITFRREKRRLQEKLRRQKKNFKIQQILRDRYEKGNFDGLIPGVSTLKPEVRLSTQHTLKTYLTYAFLSFLSICGGFITTMTT